MTPVYHAKCTDGRRNEKYASSNTIAKQTGKDCPKEVPDVEHAVDEQLCVCINDTNVGEDLCQI